MRTGFLSSPVATTIAFMKVSVTRSGGIAGVTRRWEAVVDDQPDGESLLTLLRTLPWDDLPHDASESARDHFSYRIDCEAHEPDFPQPREAVIPDQNLTGAWHELVDRVCRRDLEQLNPR